MTTDTPPTDPGHLARLRSAPRFAWLMAVLLLAAAGIGARELTRLDYLADSLGGEVGVGLVALVFAVALASGSLLTGQLVDRRDARPVLVASLLVSGAVAALNAWTLTRGPMSVAWLLGTTALEAAVLGASATALLKVQAALVPPDARGAAETVNIVRSGLGVAVGTVAAGVLGDPVPGLTLAAVLMACAGVGAGVVVWPVAVPRSHRGEARSHPEEARSHRGKAGLAFLVSAVRAHPALRTTVVVDLTLALVLPTQFIALVITDQAATKLDTIAFTSSLLGLLVGRLVLMATGVGSEVARRLRTAYLAFTLLVFLAVPALLGGWILDYPTLVGSILFVGGALLAFTQNVPVALLQQQVPEHIRGSLSGAMNGARNLFVAVAAVSLAALTYVTEAAVLAAGMCVLLVVGYVAAGRFRGLGVNEPSRPS